MIGSALTHRRIRPALFTAMALLPALSLGQQSVLQDWHIHGSNTARISNYDVRGPKAAGPWPFEGFMAHDEFNIYLDKRSSAYDLWRGEISGVVNDDDYRAQDKGIVPERISLVRENGNGALPYRIEAGDYFAYYSYLTLQRSMKGLQVELQPGGSGNGRRHSLVLTTGADEANWRDLTPRDNYTSGLSWLMQDPQLGSLSANVIHNFRDNSVKLGTLDRNQFVFSLAGEKTFSFEDQRLVLEGEIAHFGGDHDGLTGALSGQDRADNGYFAQLSGNSTKRPWDYRIRYEHYGQDFRPQGAIVSADRRSFEAHGGWRFDSGIRLRGRAQVFDDGFETVNSTRTRTYGLNLSGPLLQRLLPDVNGRVDAFIQNRNNQAGTVSLLTQSLNIDLSKPLAAGWTGRFGGFLQNVDDRSAANADLLTQQLALSADHGITLAGFRGFVTPGIMIRHLHKSTNNRVDMSPTLALHLSRGSHAFNLDYATLSQNNRSGGTGPDIDTHNLNLDYQYRRRQHLFGVEANLSRRDPDAAVPTDAYRLSAYWTYQFDRPPQAQPSTLALGVAAPVTTPFEGNLLELAPGTREAVVLEFLARSGITGGAPQADYRVYETPLLKDVFRRQRLALRFIGGSLERSAIIIDFEDVGDRNSVLQTFEQARKKLIQLLGNPTRTVQQGEFSSRFAADVNDQRLIRISEWAAPAGVIRYGIPRRLDGRVRMEIQYAKRFPQSRETRWSIESVR